MSIIKTPDQRVRVFISSTINELSDERSAAREAINNLRLTPVFFEAGARPHPPRDLYSAYLDQSHIFLGIYWNSYGWVAPGSDISGLEDEYRLCGPKPKLIYVKKSGERQEKLNHLLGEIEGSDSACYQRFSDASELRILIENDLSVLMSEIFENALFTQQSSNTTHTFEQITERKVELPLIRSELIGRDEDMKALMQLVMTPGVGMVNILGAGGTGKTSIATHLAHKLKDEFADGALFVPLAPVTDSNLVASTVANIVGLQDNGKQSVREALVEYLVDKKLLLVLDNFEQIVEAADVVSDITSKCPGVKIIVTSRRSLHIRGERIYNLLPLALPGEDGNTTKNNFSDFPSIQLFVERAREVNAQQQFDAANMEAIAEICQRLDGLPLAIELAAARTKFFQPAQLLSRMGKTLDLVSKGHKDLPERQQTLRAAIAWSYNLLDDDAKNFFRILGTFKRSWTMESVDAIINALGYNFDVEEMMEQLLNVSLIKPVLVGHSSEPRFNMLQTVHEYASEMLDASDNSKAVRRAYADYFLSLVEQSEGQLWGTNSEPWFDKMEYEFQNIRAAFYIHVEQENFEGAWKFFYLVFMYWQARGGFSEMSAWKTAAHIDCKEEAVNPKLQAIDARVRGKALMWMAYCEFFVIWIESGFANLHRAEELLREAGDENNLAIAMVMDGGYGVYCQTPDYEEKMQEAERLVVKTNNIIANGFLCSWATEYYRAKGNHELVEQRISEMERIAIEQDMYVIRFFINIIRLTNLYFTNKDYEASAKLTLEVFNWMPQKSYKAIRGSLLGGYGGCLIMQDKLEEAKPVMLAAGELIRESGDKESLYHALMASIVYFKKLGRPEIAVKVWGAINQFIETAHYPISGQTQHEYDEGKVYGAPAEGDTNQERWYEEGKKLSLEETMAMVMRETS